jgi:hypothetical protein
MLAFAPDGNPIDVALEEADVRNGVFRNSFSHEEDGSIGFEPDSHSEVMWDNGRPLTRDGERLFCSTGGEICKESELTLVPQKWEVELEDGSTEIFVVNPRQVEDSEEFGPKEAGDLFVEQSSGVDYLSVAKITPYNE